MIFEATRNTIKHDNVTMSLAGPVFSQPTSLWLDTNHHLQSWLQTRHLLYQDARHLLQQQKIHQTHPCPPHPRVSSISLSCLVSFLLLLQQMYLDTSTTDVLSAAKAADGVFLSSNDPGWNWLIGAHMASFAHS